MSMTMNETPSPRRADAGFTLIEALVAMVILVFGLMAVTNLLVVAASSNTVGNHSSAATAQATEVLERLKGIPFNALQAGGDLETDTGATVPCDDAASGFTCVRRGNYNSYKTVPGVGTIRTRWKISLVSGGVHFIEVRSESTSLLAGRRSRAEFTTFRSCTAVQLGCNLPPP
jgi:prepilin-type N-terminal cleavage/methylation domain-containing protein